MDRRSGRGDYPDEIETRYFLDIASSWTRREKVWREGRFRKGASRANVVLGWVLDLGGGSLVSCFGTPYELEANP